MSPPETARVSEARLRDIKNVIEPKGNTWTGYISQPMVSVVQHSEMHAMASELLSRRAQDALHEAARKVAEHALLHLVDGAGDPHGCTNCHILSRDYKSFDAAAPAPSAPATAGAEPNQAGGADGSATRKDAGVVPDDSGTIRCGSPSPPAPSSPSPARGAAAPSPESASLRAEVALLQSERDQIAVDSGMILKRAHMAEADVASLRALIRAWAEAGSRVIVSPLVPKPTNEGEDPVVTAYQIAAARLRAAGEEKP